MEFGSLISVSLIGFFGFLQKLGLPSFLNELCY